MSLPKWFVMLLVLAPFAMSGCGKKPVSAPTEFETWNSKDGTFRIDYPKDWEAEGGGKSAYQWARFEGDGARIQVGVSLTDSILGDIAGVSESFIGDAGFGDAGFGDAGFGDLPDQPRPAEIVHEANQEIVLDGRGYMKFKERNGTELRTTLGPAWRTEFTAIRGLGNKVRGYRATILGTELAIHVLIHCRDSDWETLQPVFLEILEGMHRGVVEM